MGGDGRGIAGRLMVGTGEGEGGKRLLVYTYSGSFYNNYIVFLKTQLDIPKRRDIMQ